MTKTFVCYDAVTALTEHFCENAVGPVCPPAPRPPDSSSMNEPRHLASWSVEETAAGFVVRDHDRQA
jgi:hypothetical protein